MNRLFRDDGRSLTVAMDHGGVASVYPALADPPRVLEAVVAGGADAILTTPGILKEFVRELKSIGVILRVDGGTTALAGESTGYRRMMSVTDALRLGADAVACMGFPGTVWEGETLGNLAALVAQGQRWGVPVMAEMLPGGFINTAIQTMENIRLAVRIGIELGADLIKTKYVGPPESFLQITRNAYRPVLVLGGPQGTERELFTMIKNALDHGAQGVVIGRNVWGHTHPRAMVMALSQLIHDNVSVEQALDTVARSSRS
jgi:class I fructose-bisphosphate aldolase